MKKLIVANLKMNFGQEETKQYINALISNISNDKNEVAVCFPFTNLSVASQILFGKKIFIGAQNVHQEESGAFTGEISAKMLKELECEYVLVGHSERRQYFCEKNKIINAKIKTLMKYGIRPILCVGETEKEFENEKTKQIIKMQIEQAINGLYENELKSVVIAYEPTWAISSGKNLSIKQSVEIVKFIREIIKQNYSQSACESAQILIGGSIKNENVKGYLQQHEINGVLIGSASLNAIGFAKIINEN